MEEVSNPNPKLLALLEKMAKPVESLAVNIEIGGVFVFPEEWKKDDELNPGLFSYKLEFQGAELNEGKIIPREYTEQEKKDMEEAQAAKKKAPPKEAKKGQPEVPQLNPEELEKQQQLEQERLEAERIAKEEWDALTEEQRYYKTREDKYKNDSLKFEDNARAIEKEGEDLAAFEDCVDAGGAWLYLTRFPTVPEEEIAKMRKTKPKNINLLDLSPCTMKAWIDLSAFQTPGQANIEHRAKVERFYNPEDKPEELANPKLDNTYVLVRIALDPPITPLITDIQPKVEEMVPRPLPVPKLPASNELINELKGQLVATMESLGSEYSAMLPKETNSGQEPKGKLHLSDQQKREIREQRKEKFLSEFQTTGKYTILKEKMKKCIMKIVRDKFQKTGSLASIAPDVKDQFYSELYSFLIEQMRQTLNDVITDRKNELHEDLVASMKQANKERDTVITTITNESPADRELRLATENEIINHLSQSEKAFKNLINVDRENHKHSYLYCQYLLRRKNFPKAEEILNDALRNSPENKVYTILLACLLARRDRKKEAINYLEDILDRDPFESLPNTLMAFIYSKLMNDPKLGRKYLAVSQRILMRKMNLLQPKASPKSLVLDSGPMFKMPSNQQTPDENAAKKIVLTDDQSDEIWTEAAEYLVKNGLYDLAEQVIEEIREKGAAKVEFFKAQILFIKGDVNGSIEILDKLIKAYPKSHEYLLAKANYCFEKDKYYEAEETFLQAFKLRSNVKTFATFLRLGYTFLYRKAWSDARSVLTKACDMKSKSSLGWLGLGIACFRTGEYQEGEQALTQANVYDPLNAEVWGYLALLCLHDGSRMVQANQALKEMLKCELRNGALLEELADRLVVLGKLDIAETLYKKLLDSWQDSPIVSSNDIGTVHSKLAKIFHTQERLVDAKLYYLEALKFLEGETDRDRVELILNDIKAAMEAGGSPRS